MEHIAIYPGSFDPITNGHLDVMERALKLFDKVYFLIAENSNKKSFFSQEQRVCMAKEVFKDYPNVIVASTNNLTVTFAKEVGANAIIRGLRAVTDFEFEFSLAAVNEYLDSNIEMVFLMATREKGFISSSNVKELYAHGVDINSLVPTPVLKYLKKATD